jgi:hypothetical protein
MSERRRKVPKWPRYPSIFEINTCVWLDDLREKYGVFMELGSVPAAEWDAIAQLGFDAVWFMGVWERSPVGVSISNRNSGLVNEFRRVLPDFHPLDNIGSAYCIRRYVVDELLGGRGGLATAREELAKRGVRLVLDFVPNHVAADHPWAFEYPEYFIRGSEADVKDDPGSYIEVDGRVFANGRDPYFPAWQDVLQVNAFNPGLRRAAIDTLLSIAAQSDGVRCDMAMLLLNPVFEKTWAARAGERPASEYWDQIIPAVKQAHPDFLLIAEAYWDLEWELQQRGFDFCYDKRLYDRLERDTPESVRLHLSADPSYQNKLLRFLENHDEPRAAAVFAPAREQAAGVVTATLPGARLFHEGQLEGRKVKLPVFLSRRPKECADPQILAFYQRLLHTINNPVFREGAWGLCQCTGWPDNASYQNVVAWSWTREEQRYLIVVNLSEHSAQGRVRLPWSDIQGKTLNLIDAFSGAAVERSGDEIRGEGLYVELGPWGYHFFRCHHAGEQAVGLAA